MPSSPALAETLRARRIAAGLTQRDLAEKAGVPQPNVSAYELGHRKPNAETLERMNRALRAPTMARVRGQRSALLSAAARRGLTELRVFGSVARGDADADSDVDILVQPGPRTSLFDLAGFTAEAEALLSSPVDVISDRGEGDVIDRIRRESIPL